MTDATSPDPVALVERLLKVESGNADFVTGLCTNWHRNPEGPEAADLIERQAATLEAMASALEITRDRLMSWPLDDVETCMCGSLVKDHDIGSGHSPVSQADHGFKVLVEDIDTTLTQYRQGDL